jgi:hypothetical protein
MHILTDKGSAGTLDRPVMSAVVKVLAQLVAKQVSSYVAKMDLLGGILPWHKVCHWKMLSSEI